MCGRKPGTPGERRIHLVGSLALSRDHAEFVVSESVSVGGRVVLKLSVTDKLSKFGTYVNGGERLVADKAYPVRVNDVISFGTVGNAFKIRVGEFPVVVCSSRMHSTTDKQALGDACKALGASTCKSVMDSDVTHLIVNSKMVPTMKLILAAARGIPIMTVGYLQSLGVCACAWFVYYITLSHFQRLIQRSNPTAGILRYGGGDVRNLYDPLPCTTDYAPVLLGSDKKKVTADLGVQEWRRSHLSQFIFLCCKEPLHNLRPIIKASGGKVIPVPEDAKDLINFLSKHPWRNAEVSIRSNQEHVCGFEYNARELIFVHFSSTPQYRGREPVWMPTERQFHLGGKGELSALFNVIWPSSGEVKLTDKQKLLYTILTRSDFIVTNMEHLYHGTSPGGTVNGSGQAEGDNFGGLTTTLTTRSSGNSVTTSSGKQPVEEELTSVATTSRDVKSLITSVPRPIRPTLNRERGFSQAAAINEEQVFAAAKPPNRRQSWLNTLNVKEKENNNAAVKHRERIVTADEPPATKPDTKGPVLTSLFGDMSENTTTIIAETEKQLVDDCRMSPPPQQMSDSNGWVQFLGRGDNEEHHHAIRQGDGEESVVEQQETTLSPADTKYIKLILSEEERVAISKTLDGNDESSKTKYGATLTHFRKNAVPPPPSNPISMEMLIEMAPSATSKVSILFDPLYIA